MLPWELSREELELSMLRLGEEGEVELESLLMPARDIFTFL